jgi:hypothetical protein
MTATIAETTLPTAEHIAALFRKHDIIPRQRVYLDTSGLFGLKCRACAIGILLVEIRGSAAAARADCRRSNRSVFNEYRLASGLPRAFLDGLDDGVTDSDGGEFPVNAEALDGLKSLYIEGYRVGWKSYGLASAGAGVLAEDRP